MTGGRTENMTTETRPTTDDLLALLTDYPAWTALPEMLGRYALLRRLLVLRTIQVRTITATYWDNHTPFFEGIEARIIPNPKEI